MEKRRLPIEEKTTNNVKLFNRGVLDFQFRTLQNTMTPIANMPRNGINPLVKLIVVLTIYLQRLCKDLGKIGSDKKRNSSAVLKYALYKKIRSNQCYFITNNPYIIVNFFTLI